MANLQDFEVWEKRWQALNEAINTYADWLQPHVSSSPRAKRLYCLVKRLQAFAEGHFYYFYDGFRGNCNYKLKEVREYPPEHVFSVILDQIADDLEVIQRAAVQVISGTEDMVSALETADKLARQALIPAMNRGWFEFEKAPTIITYFQKSAAIRVIPYDDDAIALIAVPWTSLGVPRDFLATPHEVGHHLFWNGKVGKTPIRAMIRNLLGKEPEWVRPWTEEIFADVYGCLVAGPLIALDFQDLQMEESTENFLQDDGEHPAPLVRPYIYTNVLEERKKLNDWAERLKERWVYHLKHERGNPKSFVLQTSGLSSRLLSYLAKRLGQYEVALDDAQETLGQAVKGIYKFHDDQGLRFDANWWGEFAYPSVAPPAPGNFAELDKLYKKFDEDIKTRPLPEAPLCEVEKCETEDIWNEWASGLDATDLTEEEIAQSEVFSSLRAGEISQSDVFDRLHSGEIDPITWKVVWIADGWATRGPQTSGD